MESTNEAVIENKKRPKTPTRYPKRIMPTFVVAFAVQDSPDDSQKLEQITNKRSADSTDSVQSISPTGSISTISPTETFPSVVDMTNLQKLKIDIVDENQYGDVTEKMSAQFSNHIVIDTRTENEQPEITFNASKHTKIYKVNNKYPKKKPKKRERDNKFTNIHFKYKKSKNSITRTLEKYYGNPKLNTLNAEQIQKQIYCHDSSMVVVRSRISAKEYVLADSERISPQDDVSIDYDDESLKCSPSSAKKSFISHTSQKTLVYEESFSSRNEEEYCSITATNSVTQVTSDKQGTDEIACCNRSCEKLMSKEYLSSAEAFLQNNTTLLTSTPSSGELKSYKINKSNLNPLHIIERSVTPVLKRCSDNDTLVNALTNLDLNNSRTSFNLMSQINSQTTDHSENVQYSLPTNDNFSNDISENYTLLDRVKTLGFYPMKAHNISSRTSIDCESNDVIVTDNINKVWSFTRDTNSLSDDCPTDTKRTFILRKPVEVENMNYFQNNIRLPDGVNIKAKLNEKRVQKRSCADEIGDKYPTNMVDMWEQVTLVIDLAVKRLEESFVHRILNDIKESLPIFNQPEYKIPTAEIIPDTTAVARDNDVRPIMLHKTVFVKEEHLKLDVDECVQCDLVHREVLDQLMLQLSLIPKPNPASGEAMKLLKPPELLKDYTEVLKPPVAHITDSVSAEEGRADTATVSTATTELSTVRSFRRLKRLMSIPVKVLRENMIIMTSVPTFFIVLFCLYGFIIVVMKP